LNLHYKIPDLGVGTHFLIISIFDSTVGFIMECPTKLPLYLYHIMVSPSLENVNGLAKSLQDLQEPKVCLVFLKLVYVHTFYIRTVVFLHCLFF
jgi:hypothetical protein